ncbi:MAG: thioredoxin domain-containing protein [Candidatus Heteroscillospira sp.]|jgi:uncharacterized protein YyaL (SSP411 family)
MYTNYLEGQRSPYLRQHANDPVHWFPWGDEALEKARREDKPIFISIGYSTCHWCHVMARESFRNEAVAAKLNRDFIAVKVDREERPDVDSLYMRMAQLLGGGGGWPASIFASPDGRPFYAGTYFPKDAFLRLLDSVAAAWRGSRAQLQQNGELVIQAVRSEESRTIPETEAPTDRAVEQLRESYDSEFGGFGSPPKFPTPHIIALMLHFEPEMAEKTLERMYLGGIFDHLGGGFSRYSTDRFWLVPHFEKMLYDNALLAMVYLMAWERNPKPLYRYVAEKIFQYMESELLAENGGFYAAQDADTDGEEGKYYLFTPEELALLLGKEDAERFCAKYGITRGGHLEGKSVPNLLTGSGEEVPRELMDKVLAYRKSRSALQTDSKQLTAWNSLAACAYAVAGRILGDEKYLARAEKTLDFIENNLVKGKLRTCVTEGEPGVAAFLEDYAFLAWAYYELYQAQGDEKYLRRAFELTDEAIRQFFHRERGGFYSTGEENEKLAARLKESYDGALPSGNSVMAYLLERLSLLNEGKYGAVLEKQRRYMNARAQASPTGHSFYLWARLPVKKVICAAAGGRRPEELRVRSDWVFRCTGGEEYPLLNGKTAYYVCEGSKCLPPAAEPPSDQGVTLGGAVQ